MQMERRLDFDAQLPKLGQAFDRELVMRLFEQNWPAAAPAPKNIVSAKLQDTKYQPQRRCVATYQLSLDMGDRSSQQTIGVIEVTPAGVSVRLYSEDPSLPHLAAAADAAGMRERFGQLLGENVIHSCVITPVRYRSGARCVFRYDLQTEAGTQVYFGKLMGEGGDVLMSTVSALHDASLEHAEMPRIMPPLAYWPDLQMLVQPEVVGRAELNDLAFDPNTEQGLRERWLHEAGGRLAGLHSLKGVAGPQRSLAGDLDELREYIAPMQIADQQLAERYARAIDAVGDRAREQADLAPVASHGAFRTDQFMIEGDHLVMIDLDGFCWASPARDLGNYLAYLGWKRIRQPQRAAFIEQAGHMLLQGYQAQRQLPPASWLAVYQAASMLKVAGRRYRSLTVKEWPLVPALLDAAELALLRITD